MINDGFSFFFKKKTFFTDFPCPPPLKKKMAEPHVTMNNEMEFIKPIEQERIVEFSWDLHPSANEGPDRPNKSSQFVSLNKKDTVALHLKGPYDSLKSFSGNEPTNAHAVCAVNILGITNTNNFKIGITPHREEIVNGKAIYVPMCNRPVISDAGRYTYGAEPGMSRAVGEFTPFNIYKSPVSATILQADSYNNKPIEKLMSETTRLSTTGNKESTNVDDWVRLVPISSPLYSLCQETYPLAHPGEPAPAVVDNHIRVTEAHFIGVCESFEDGRKDMPKDIMDISKIKLLITRSDGLPLDPKVNLKGNISLHFSYYSMNDFGKLADASFGDAERHRVRLPLDAVFKRSLMLKSQEQQELIKKASQLHNGK